jgi:hypothetical protein
MSRRRLQYSDHITSQRNSSRTSQHPSQTGSSNSQSRDSSPLPGSSSVGRSSPFQAGNTQVQRRVVPAVDPPGLSTPVNYVENTSDLESSDIPERPRKRVYVVTSNVQIMEMGRQADMGEQESKIRNATGTRDTKDR